MVGGGRYPGVPPRARRALSGTELTPQGRTGDPAKSPLVRRTGARPAGSGGCARWVGESAETFLRRALALGNLFRAVHILY
jgi:hypothetical protein